MTTATRLKPTPTALYEAAADLVADALTIGRDQVAKLVDDRFNLTGDEREKTIERTLTAATMLTTPHREAMKRSRENIKPLVDTFRKAGL